MGDTILEWSDLSFLSTIRYPDCRIRRGEVVFVSGQSGSGKSSLFRLINATANPSSGRILLDGRDIRDENSLEWRKKVLLAGQTFYLFGGSIAENFRKYHEYTGTTPPEKEEMVRLLHACCIDFAPDTSCDTFSGGEKQRVFLSIAISYSPQILLLDEPTSALDAATASCLLENLLTHARETGITLLIISHDSALRARFADTVIPLGGLS